LRHEIKEISGIPPHKRSTAMLTVLADTLMVALRRRNDPTDAHPWADRFVPTAMRDAETDRTRRAHAFRDLNW
jgi:hypothetical protein